MFWSGNYTANRELKLLLVEKNVTLTQVLEADDILQECKADYHTLSQFLSRPDILSELITLITEEPPKNVELSLQYRHANIACEVLTSNLSLLRDRLSSNTVQMNRLCDFVYKEPPLNPLLASYFSKTIDMLLEKSPKMDWYLHHIVCLRVLDFFKSRRDFVPNLLRHISTSAICDTFRCFLQTITNTNIVLEWLDEYHFLDCLIQIICGTHNPEEAFPALSDTEEKATNEPNEKLDTNHNGEPEETAEGSAGLAEKEAETNGEREEAGGGGGGESDHGGDGDARDQRAAREERLRRTRSVAAANAAALLCDIALECGPDTVYVYLNRWGAGKDLGRRLRREETVRRVLQGCFTSPAGARRSAVVHACRLLLALLKRPPPSEPVPGSEAAEAEAEEEYRGVERAVAPHLPLLHRALLKDVDEDEPGESSWVSGAAGGARRAAGAARVHVAALVARLALSDVDDVPTALISLGTAGVLVDLSFSCSHNNFLHAQLVALVRNARNNVRFGERYTTHLIEECDLLVRLMDAFEENESGKLRPRAGYMGHVVLLLGELHERPPALPPGQLLQRWTAFREERLKPLLLLHHAPLGGVYPQEDFQELKFPITFQSLVDRSSNNVNRDAYVNFMAQASEHFNENVWDESPADEADEVDEVDVLDDGDAADDADDDRLEEQAMRVLSQKSPWEDTSPDGPAGGSPAGSSEAAAGSADGGEGWAHFDTPFNMYPFFAPSHDPESPSISGALQNLRVSDDDKDALTILLAHKMLAFHNMSPENYEPQEGDLDTQTHTDGQSHSSLTEADQSSHDGRSHTALSKENQNAPDDQNQSFQDSQNQSIHNVPIKNAQDDQHRDKQACKDGQNQSSEEGQNLSVHDGQNQSSKNNKNQSAHEVQKQSAEAGENQSAHDSQNQSSHDNQNQSAHDDENQSAHDGQNQSSHDDQNQSAHEASSAYDSPRADAES